MKLINCTQLAEHLDKVPSFVTAMKRAGYVFKVHAAGRTTIEHAVEWLEAHPEFVANDYLVKGWERVPKLPAVRLCLAASGAGK